MKKRFQNIIPFLLCISMLTSSLTCQTSAISTSASAAVLMDADSGRILYAHNEQERMRIASTTKIMTALVALENGCLSDAVTVKRSQTLVEGTSMYLKEGEKLTLETLLYGLLLCSGNDAALAVADAVGGSQEKFVVMMNDKARELGMTGTSFANPNGLDNDKHYSTALDMAKLARAAMDNETFVRIVSTRQITIGGRTMTNHNKLLSYMDGCLGLKTGYTKAAGRTLVSCAVRNGQRLIAVTLQDGNDWADHEALYEYGFSTYPAKTAVTRGETLTSVRIQSGIAPTVPLVAVDSFAWPVAAGETLSVELSGVPHKMTAPVTAGTSAGEAVILLNGKEVGRVKLVCGGDVLPSLPESVSLFHRLENVLCK
ncbi:MAG: D-alanyl-D-alanine carboxypeptidase [Oscillibacter sp.]|jgi:D-alanyl-D-alanine carboxypeptidase|nr:D-alanyl-D-alanine carboxypeptidase [Oscillibacter sp.]